MINRKNYSDELYKISFSIGGLELNKINKQVKNLLNRTDSTFTITELSQQLVVIIELPIQNIPDYVGMFINEGLALYEIKEINN